MDGLMARRGISLLEMIIAVSIFAVLFAAVFTYLHRMTIDVSDEIASSVLNQETVRGLDRMAEKLRAAKFQNLPDAGAPGVEFFVPVDHDKDGDSVDANLAVDWGQRRPGGDKLNAVTVFRFVKTSEFNESTKKYDLNRDGDTKDRFEIGRLEEALYDTATATGSPFSVRPVTPDILIQVYGKSVADIDGDSQDDPIFMEDGTRLRIRMFVTRAKDAKPLFERFETSVALRNQ